LLRRARGLLIPDVIAKQDQAMELRVNGTTVSLDADPDMPLLWVLRDVAGLTGTKFGCGIAQCGSCTVHIDGRPVRSCVIPAANAAGRQITTIEGIGGGKGTLHPVQQAWIDEQVPQCGYCQSGQIMKAAELLARNKKPSREQIVAHMDGNICRCGTYTRIIAAIRRAAQEG